MRYPSRFCRLLLASACMLGAAIAHAQPVTPSPAKPLSAADVVKAAPAASWVAIDPHDLLVMTLAPDTKGQPREVLIQLMPAPFSQGWVGNLRKLAAAHWWDGLSVYRVQDNWVAQWGDGEGEDKAKAKPLPEGLAKVDESQYTVDVGPVDIASYAGNRFGLFMAEAKGVKPHRLIANLLPEMTDAFLAGQGLPGFTQGWPVAARTPNENDHQHSALWPIHCYGTVGVARDLSPDTGTGAELYAVIGQPPRQLDRNIAVVGRVVEGIQFLSALPRAPDNGVYKDAADRTPILSVRLASDLPADQQPHMEYLSTQSSDFTRYADLRAHRKDDFIKVAASGADICSIPVPVRRHPAS